MIFFIKGYLIEITKWNLSNNKSKKIIDTKFIPELECHLFKDYLVKEGYKNTNGYVFYKLEDDYLEVIQFKGNFAKSYIYRNDKVVFWNREIDIIVISSIDINKYLIKVADDKPLDNVVMDKIDE